MFTIIIVKPLNVIIKHSESNTTKILFDVTLTNVSDIIKLKLLEQNHLQDVEKLFIEYNKLTNISGLNNFPNLRYLSINTNLIKNLQYFYNLKYLEELYMNDNKLTTLKDLPSLPSLSILSIMDNKLINLKLPDLPNIYYLSANYNKINTLLDLPYLKSLKILMIGNNNLITLNGIQNLPNLELLYCPDNNLKSLYNLLYLPVTLKNLHINTIKIFDKAKLLS